MTTTTTTASSTTFAGAAASAGAAARPEADAVLKALGRRSFATLASVSPDGVPHVAGVLYALSGRAMYVSTGRSSRKARNVTATGRVAVTVPVRRLPVGPPASVQFQTTARVVDADDPELRAALATGDLKGITSHGELDLPGGCFLRVELPRKLHTYGLGLSLRRLMSHPLSAGGQVQLSPA